MSTDAFQALQQSLAAFDDYLAHTRRSSKNTRDSYARDLRAFLNWLQTAGIDPFSPGDLGPWLQHLQARGLGASSMNRHLSSAKVYYRWLYSQQQVTAQALNVVLLTPALKTWQLLPAVLSLDEAARLMNAPRPTDRYYLRDRALLEVLYATGCRASEVCDMTLANLHLEEGYADVLGKGKRERRVLLHQTALAALTAYLQQERPRLVFLRPEVPWVFVSKGGTRLTRVRIWQLVKSSARRAGLPARIGVHTLRHSMASHLLAGGADLRVTQDLLGHAHLNITQRYLKVDAQRMQEQHRLHHPLASAPPETNLPRAG